MAIYANLSIDQGSTFNSSVAVVGSNGLTYDLTGYTSRGQIRKNYKSLTYTAFACSIDSPVSGAINISLTAARIAATLGANSVSLDLIPTAVTAGATATGAFVGSDCRRQVPAWVNRNA